MTVIAGVDIGGTKCAVSLGRLKTDGSVEIAAKEKFPTPATPEQALEDISQTLTILLENNGRPHLKGIGISCGGPLNSTTGRVLSPPNLPGWDNIDVVTPLRERFNVPAALQNDANAGALAEWQWGAGRGCQNMVFLTFGTGMGAGLILNGQLYSGTNDMAGEVGHIRLAQDGPLGYGKRGSFEGFCSGGGIARLAHSLAEEHLKSGKTTQLCASYQDINKITAQKVGEAAQNGDELALHIFDVVARNLGLGLSILVDILNPEKIVIGSIYVRQQTLLQQRVLKTLRAEALSHSLSVCEIAPAGLGEMVGDYASLAVAKHLVFC